MQINHNCNCIKVHIYPCDIALVKDSHPSLRVI